MSLSNFTIDPKAACVLRVTGGTSSILNSASCCPTDIAAALEALGDQVKDEEIVIIPKFKYTDDRL